jgi:2-hydroxy fatty acid dioxygenase
MGKSKAFDLDYQYVKYGEYHFNATNEVIHMIFVPLILFTVQVWLSHPLITTFLPFAVNPALIITIFYNIYFFALWPLVALLYSPFLFGACCGYFDLTPAHITSHYNRHTWAFLLLCGH